MNIRKPNLNSTEITDCTCAVCKGPEEDDVGMVGCDNCSQWFHFKCVGVSANVKEISWSCINCKDKTSTGAEDGGLTEPAAQQKEDLSPNAVDGGISKLMDDTSDDLSAVAELEQELERIEKMRQDQMRRMELERKVHRRRLEVQRELAEQKQKLEREKRQMELEMEKEQLQRAIAEEEAFRKQQQAMRDELQRNFEQLRIRQLGPSKQAMAICGPESSEKRSAVSESVIADAGVPEQGAPGQSASGQDTSGQGAAGQVGSGQAADYRGAYSKHSMPKQAEENSSLIPQKEPTFQPMALSSANVVLDEAAAPVATPFVQAAREQISAQLSARPNPNAVPLVQPARGPTNAQLSARQFIAKKLPVFTGRPEDWPMFISCYETANDACGFSNVENLARLQESLKGPALEAVRSRLLLPNSVPQVIDSLRMLYGRPEQLLNMLLAKVRKTEAPKADRLNTFINFGMVVQQLADHLEATNLRDHLVNPMLIQELAEKLPASTKMEWVRYKRQVVGVTLRTLADFLSEIVRDASEATLFADPTTSARPPPDNRPNRKGKANKGKEYEGFVHTHGGAENVSSKKVDEPQQEKRSPCPMCDRTDHRIRNCSEFRKMDPVDRLKTAEELELCRICLNNHGKAKCKLNIVCKVENCGQRHNTLLHQPRAVLRSDCNTHVQVGLCQPIIFRMVAVTIYNGPHAINTLAFLDEGSSYTLVESSLADRLKVKGKTLPLRVTWTAGMSRLERESKQLKLTLSARGSKEKYQIQNVHTVQALKLPEQALRYAEIAKQYQHLQNLPVVDYEMEPPKILIGLKHLHLFAPLESRIGKPGEPIAVRSKLGWTVYGSQNPEEAISPFVGYHSCDGVTNQELHDLLRSHYALEDAGVSVNLLPESSEDQRARSIMESTTVKIGDRFQTGLLWRKDDVQFPDSYKMAHRRMKCLERRLREKPELKNKVEMQIVEYQQKGYCHKATEEELTCVDPKKVWYLPLNIVLNPKKPEKVRLVWDAAAAVEKVSLNSQLLKGPDFLTSLPSVICQFREHRIGFGGDIREMFHQVKIRPEDRQAQRFLFSGQVFVMDCAIFGATCSPSQAMYVKDINAKQWETKYPDASVAIVKKHYVDDYFDSVHTVEEAVKRAKEVRFIHSRAGFEIRNWVSNSGEFLKQLGETQRNAAVHFNRDKTTDTERVLGIVWSPVEDVFTFSTKMRDDLLPYLFERKRPTKRVVLSCVMSLFDPLGLLTPFTIYGRILIQKLWRSGCEWDEVIDDESAKHWTLWTSYLSAVEEVRVPRYHFGDGMSLDYESLQLHVFTDASEGAYGCAAYFRIMAGGFPRCSLVQAKSKVAPLKPYTIPRLELMAAVLGARMVDTIKETHNLKVGKVYLWTDSSTVLSWIRSDLWRYRIFTALRVGDILNRTMASDWRWVPTRQNVADEVTKWTDDGPNMGVDSRWFKSSQFLYQSEEKWPTQPEIKPNVREELRTAFLFHDLEVVEPLINVERFSKWNVLVRTIACVLRFIGNIRRKQQGKKIEVLPTTSKVSSIIQQSVPCEKRSLSKEEFEEAERVLWKMAQGERFAAEIRILQKKSSIKVLPKADVDCDLHKLTPLLDEFGVLRHEGRTTEAEFLPFEMRFPIILPRRHPITTKLLEYYHQKFGHANRETVVNQLRQKFYIPHIRAQLKKVMQTCVWCKVHKCRPRVPRMAPLPVQRLTPNMRPFSFTGVDYFGPLVVTVGRRSEKRWVSLFTCLTTRAIHLEVVHSLSSQSCVMAIRRFACRRGMPVEFFSDNGTNFVGACKEVIGKIGEDCSEVFTDARTRWNFNPPSAPHMGGAWERLVRSVKEAIKVFDDGRKLTDEVLLTTLADAEDMINSRPLTYVPQESAEAESLTPNHFIRGLPSVGKEVFKSTTGEAEALRDSYKRSQLLADKMWKRWLEEYLPSINQRSKWHAESEPIVQGEVVFLADDDNRKIWVRGVVEELIRGADGRVRQAVVRTSKGSYRRPVAKLAVPEIRCVNSGLLETSQELRGGAVEAPPTGSTVHAH